MYNQLIGSFEHCPDRTLPNLDCWPARHLRLWCDISSWPNGLVAAHALVLDVATPFYRTTLSRLVLSFRHSRSHAPIPPPIQNQRLALRSVPFRCPVILTSVLGVLLLPINIHGVPRHTSRAFGFLPQEPLLAPRQLRTHLSIRRFWRLDNKSALDIMPPLFLSHFLFLAREEPVSILLQLIRIT